MRLTIILLLVSSVCFGQGVSFSGDAPGGQVMTKTGEKIKFTPIRDTIPKPTIMDTLKAPLISILEVQDFLINIDRKLIAMLELDLIKESEFKQLRAELNKVVAVLEKKRKTFK